MRLEIKNEKYNRFLKRKELDILIEHPEEATPSTASVQQLLAEQAGSQTEKTEIKEIISDKGAPMSRCLAYVWDEKTVKDLQRETKEGQGAG